MTRLFLALLFLVLLMAAPALIRRRRRRARELQVHPLPAGLKHLASQVRALSSFGMALPLPPLGAARRRGTLVGVR